LAATPYTVSFGGAEQAVINGFHAFIRISIARVVAVSVEETVAVEISENFFGSAPASE
jgi:hypothetical protein